MKKAKKVLELDHKAGRQDCDIPIYKDLPLSMVMLQGWFNDQHKCFELFFNALTCDEQAHLFTSKSHLDSVKSKYRELWNNGGFKRIATQDRGVHKLCGQLQFSWFAWWAGCVSRSTREYGSLELMISRLRTVEFAHGEFKPWFYKTKKVRNLNAADAARILARYDYLQPESRPLLARGALRGAAILLDNVPIWKNVNRLEREYADEGMRIALEEKAAKYIIDKLPFAGKFQMDMGESWFCGEQKKWRS